MGSVFNGGCRMYYTRPSDGKTYCFQPVPLLGESKEFLRTNSGDERLATIHQLTFNGTLLPMMPALSGVPDGSSCISILDRKRDQLCDALSEDRGDLLIVDGSGYPIISAKPLVSSLSFDEGIIVQQSPYTLVFEFEEVAGTGYVREYNESWSFAQNENDTVSVAHEINAVGIPNPSLNRSSVDSARDFVKSKVGGVDKTQAHIIQTPYVQGLVSVDALTAYNRVLNESSDLTAGSYNVSEAWVMSSGAFLDDRSIEQNWELDELGSLIKTVTINGTVQGYGDTTFDKLANAKTGFQTFVSPQINFSAVSGLSSKSLSENRIAGSVAYAISIAPSGDDSLTSRGISRSFERADDGSVNQTVTTSCAVRPESTLGIASAISFCFSNNFPISSAEPIFNAALSGNLVSVSTSRDELQKSFSLTRVYTDQSTPLWREEYNLDRSETLDSSQIQVTINGTVQGIGVETTTKGTSRFLSASGAYYGIIEPLISARVSQIIPTGNCVSSTAISKTFGMSPLGGTITYSQTFETRFSTSNSNILSEEIDITLARAGRVVASIAIPGKLSGPVLQDQETYTGLSKSLSIKYTMKGTANSCGGAVVANSNAILDIALAESDILVENSPSQNARGEKPESSAVFRTEDNVSFSRQRNEFTRSVTWLYI
jgi:hypothetical protein